MADTELDTTLTIDGDGPKADVPPPAPEPAALEIHEIPEIPESVVVSQTPDMRFSPNDIRQLKAQTGKTLTELTGEGADEADQMQTMAWLRLRREGHLNIGWADCGDVTIDFQPEPPDPTNSEPSTGSPPSADSGE
jgi:hypothetical protein